MWHIRNILAVVLACWVTAAGATELGVEGERFTLDGEPTFLLGISYYGALGASDEFIEKDLDEMRRYAVNWIRVWATWGAFDNDVSAVDAQGRPRDGQLEKLRTLLAACDRRGIVVDVTLSRGNGVTGANRLQTFDAHRRAVESIVSALKPYRNWYIDLGNERNIRDRRHVGFDDLRRLRDRVKRLDARRLVTASHAGDPSREDVRQYLKTVKVDFLSIHRPRNPKSPRETAARSREFRRWIEAAGPAVPLHYQEPFRRGFRPDRFGATIRGLSQSGTQDPASRLSPGCPAS